MSGCGVTPDTVPITSRKTTQMYNDSASSFEEGVTVAINSKQLRKVGTGIALFLNDEIITQRA